MPFLPVELTCYIATFIDDTYTFQSWSLTQKELWFWLTKKYNLQDLQLQLFMKSSFNDAISNRLLTLYSTAYYYDHHIYFPPYLLYRLQYIYQHKDFSTLFRIMDRHFFSHKYGMTQIRGDENNLGWFQKI